ncbi:MOLPALP family lipoprotein [Mycoplasma mycoides]|uniref:MOLPALP family lipoprotein n=1 Tax=Mycoplasma mycoides TaxID=2102 RepID=UPI002734EF79|nr:MOLPALP family lipoprotein [Mycoplasma mycoides]MDP4040433.1 MOLPALP family lipoprotein [Mycoplasma mycoides]MDP4041655.1 MOLPALP family lipoprotein [Mycoplasma mycoides]MDP4042242.1 MOLPALP family lipoprotein [Mycoplasma mycoides]MDP4043644.1 MOLPALP family lipoprotein [Mycoplasma mycoides]MDP4044520.1 MOLPALP family lipoprotein [Mycoplasma mycoides]
MKKLIAILSSMMMITTASLPIIACHTKQNKFENNNSITNTHSTASLFAKELILADQLQVNLQEIKNRNNQKDLALLLDEYNLKLDNTDSSIKNISSSDELINQYFEKDSYKNVLDSNIKLDSQKKLSNPLFSEIFKLFGLGTTNLDKFSDDITNILTLLVNLNPMFISSNFDKSNTTLQSFFKNIKPSLKTLFDSITTQKEGITKNVKEFQEKLNVNEKYKNLKVEDLDIAFYTSLINAIGLGIGTKDFKAIEIKIENTNETLQKAGEMLAKITDSPAQPTQNKEWDIVLYTLQALQFLQLKLSLFENVKSHTPTSANNLFDDKKTNQEFLTELYKDKTIENITKKRPSSINLKYLLSFFKNAVDELKDEKQLDGYELQKLLAMLFLSPNKVEYPDKGMDDSKEYYEGKKAHPLITLLAAVAKHFIENKLGELAPTEKEGIKKFTNESIPHVYKWISFASNNLLTGTKNAYDTLGILFTKTMSPILSSLIKNTTILKDKVKGKEDLIPSVPALLFALVLAPTLSIAFPIITNEKDENKNSFKVLYGGDVFLIDKLDEFFEAVKKEIKDKLSSFGVDVNQIPLDQAKPYIDIFKGIYDQIFKNVKHLNLKTLLTTPLNKIDSDSWKERNIAKPLQNKSVADILDTLLKSLNIQGNEKLADLSSSNINLTNLTDITTLIDNYTYKANGVDYQNKTQLADILKANPDKTLEILGWTFDSKKPIGSGSLIDVFLSKVFNFKTNQNTDKSENAINQLAKIIASANSSLDTLFDSNIEITFEFKDTKKNSSDQLLSETLIASVKNKNNNSESKYFFTYSRDKQDKFKFVKITKN